MARMLFLDYTLPDGGTTKPWALPPILSIGYVEAMQAAAVDVVELGFRTLKS